MLTWSAVSPKPDTDLRCGHLVCIPASFGRFVAPGFS